MSEVDDNNVTVEDLDEYEDIIENEDLDEFIENENLEEYEEILDRKESTNRGRINYLMETHSFPSIPDMHNNKCFCCPADRQGNRCCGEKWRAETWKRYEAITNLEWHHVSLRTLANIDNDMLDEKRRNYIFLYHLIKDFRKYAFEIKREDVYFDLVSNVLRNIQQLYFNNVISHKAYRYATRHVQVVSVEKGYFMSEREETFGFKKSRRYNATLR